MSENIYIAQTAGERLLLGIDRYLVRTHSWTPAAADTEDGAIPRPPWDWLCLAMEAAADLLDLMRSQPPWTLQQLIRLILDSATSDGAAPEGIVRARRRLSRKWSSLLEVDCPTAAGLLRRVLEGLREDEHREKQQWQRLVTESKKAQNQNDSNQDGIDRVFDALSEKECIPFVYKKVKYRFPYMQSLLLYVLTHDETGQVKRETLHDSSIVPRLWKRRIPEQLKSKRAKDVASVLRNRLRVLQNDTNKSLSRENLPLQIMRPKNNYLLLEKIRLMGS